MAADPYYQLYKAETLENNQEVFPYVVKGDLTPEEQAVELYDTKAMVKPSSHAFIYEQLKDSIAKIDSALGTGFLKELEDLASAEGSTTAALNKDTEQKPAENEQKPAEDVKKSPESEQKAPEAEQAKPEPAQESAPLQNTTEKQEQETKKAEETQEAPVRQVSPGSNGGGDLESVKKLTANTPEGVNAIDAITEDERKLIKGVAPDGKSIEFTTTDLTACPYCRNTQPALIATYCIFCGKKF